MKGILLAGPHATHRLPLFLDEEPVRQAANLGMVCDFSLAVLLQAGVRDIQLVAPAERLAMLQAEYGDGKHMGLSLHYQTQSNDFVEQVERLEAWLACQSVAVVQGEVLLAGEALQKQLRAALRSHGASALVYAVPGKVAGEGGAARRASVAWCGVSFFDTRFVEWVRQLAPAAVPDALRELYGLYLQDGSLQVLLLNPEVVCLDGSTSEALLATSLFVQAWEQATGRKLVCLEEIALQQGFVDAAAWEQLIRKVCCPQKRRYLQRIGRERAQQGRRAA